MRVKSMLTLYFALVDLMEQNQLERNTLLYGCQLPYIQSQSRTPQVVDQYYHPQVQGLTLSC